MITRNRTIEVVGPPMARQIVVSWYGRLASIIDCTGKPDEVIWRLLTTGDTDMLGTHASTVRDL